MKTVVFAYHDMGCLGIKPCCAVTISAIFTHTLIIPVKKPFMVPVARLAAERGIPVYAPDNVNHPLWVERIALAVTRCDFLFLLSPSYLRRDFAARSRRCAFNLHGSLLPKYRGRAPLKLGAGER